VTILDDARVVLFIHAHPDDESLSTGGLMARMAAGGTRVLLVTATRGEQGEVVDGPLSFLEGSPLLAKHRMGELDEAIAVLGVAGHYYLGEPAARAPGLTPRRYTDSGMAWGADGRAVPVPDAPADSLTSASAEEVTDDVVAAILDSQPDLVVGYDSGGGYGHPDHMRMHEAALEGARRVGVPFAMVLESSIDGASGEGDDGPGIVRVELGEHLETKRRALAAHPSQMTVVADGVVHSGGQHQAIGPVETYLLPVA
jgi:N-acetyl-1-D-myo-inositol-2-amino-2-deoxy-alpha-D-glucopyranoside deacetylase